MELFNQKIGKNAKLAKTANTVSPFIPTLIDPKLIDIIKQDTPYLGILPKMAMGQRWGVKLGDGITLNGSWK